MFEKLKKGVKRVRENVTKAKARKRGMSVAEYKEESAALKKKRQKEELKFRAFKIEEEYRQKRKRFKERGGTSGATRVLDSITNMGKNVLANVEGSSQNQRFNKALTGETSKKKRRKKKK